jgi:hypothetical protein
MCLTPHEQILMLAVRVAQAQNALEEFVRGRGLNDPGRQTELQVVRQWLDRRDDQRAIAAFERALTEADSDRALPQLAAHDMNRGVGRPLPKIMDEAAWSYRDSQ